MSESWRLKLDRAQEHLEEMNLQLWHYGNSHPYRELRVECDQHSDCWRFIMQVTRQPDPRLAITVGEAAHAIRSALDHIAVALAPPVNRDTASFPIFVNDIATDMSARARFDKAVKGMPNEAVAIIKDYQPFRLADALRVTHALRVISVIDNADKHQHLTVLAAGLVNVKSLTMARGEAITQPQAAEAFCPDGAEVAHFTWDRDPALNDAEVNVQVSGMPMLAIGFGLKDGVVRLVDLSRALWYVRDHVIPDLEPFVHKTRKSEDRS